MYSTISSCWQKSLVVLCQSRSRVIFSFIFGLFVMFSASPVQAAEYQHIGITPSGNHSAGRLLELDAIFDASTKEFSWRGSWR